MRHLPIVLMLTLALAACGRDEAPASGDAAKAATDAAVAAASADGAGDADAASGEPDLPALPAGDFRVASVSLGREVDAEGQVRTPQEAFKPTDRIHAAVVGVGTSDGLTLSARWRTADGTEVARAAQSIAPAAPTVTTFAIAQPEPWPVGEYEVDIAINERVVETSAFRVE